MGIVTKRRVYEHNGHEIVVYAGWIDHYLQINGQIVDRVKTAVGISLELKGEINGVSVRSNIGMGLFGNHVVTFINGVEAEAEK